MRVAASRRFLFTLITFASALEVGAACKSSTSATGGTGSSSGSSSGTSSGTGADVADASYDVHVKPPPDGSIHHACRLPGSVQFTENGTETVPGGDPSWPSLAFLHLPAGFCAHYYGSVGDARKIRFAPGGELFVASPSAGTTGGAFENGQNAILVLPDDNEDGVADSALPFMTFWPGDFGTTTQGMLFANGYFYYQDGDALGAGPNTNIRRMPYKSGQRKAGTSSEVVANITVYTSSLHWPKALDMADDGTIYVGNGGDQSEVCVTPHPFHGGILKIDPTGASYGGIQVAKGFRNPISVRCWRGHGTCFALELALDYSSGPAGGREKMVPIHDGDDWGFPCCATAGLAYPGSPPGTDCSAVAAENTSFVIGDTPFDLDFESGFWPDVWNGRAYVVTHGTAGAWIGARIVAIPMDPGTGMPLPSTDNGPQTGMIDFATGWDDMSNLHGRPASVAFASDGRLFVANDNNGVIFWIAPIE